MDYILYIALIAAGFILVALVMQGVGLIYPKKPKDTMHGFWMRRLK